ncbi:MAG: lipoyl synthase [Candidatus Eisenbacteria bacterium]|nr:lipoyl synthase [Candidatus Eisenbacteria bacterium]
MKQHDPSRSRTHGLAVVLEGPSAYLPVWRMQQRLAELRYRLSLPDTLLLLEHAPVITIGRHGKADHVLAGSETETVRIDRGGDVTWHGPGQLVAYWIADLHAHELGVHAFVHELEESLIASIARFGIEGFRREGLTGVWTRSHRAPGDAARDTLRGSPAIGREDESQPGWAKIAAIGVRIARWVSFHGVALNVRASALPAFREIVPCGLAGAAVTSIESEIGEGAPSFDEARSALAGAFAERFSMQWRELRHPAITTDEQAGELIARLLEESGRGARKPPWLRAGLPGGESYRNVRRTLESGALHTVCESARCPNSHECWNAGTATFLILGNQCTRACGFCAIDRDPRPAPPEEDEAERVAQAAARLGLRHVVVTSVTRDDLPDGGAAQFAATIASIRAHLPQATVEVLIPDFAGSERALERVIAARPDVLNHNVETVARLFPRVRPGADLSRSLGILKAAARAGLPAKSGFMLGLGESPREVRLLLDDLRATGCDRVTIGQYLKPAPARLPVHRFYTPEEFAAFGEEARKRGFIRVQSGPLVRSSYHAGQFAGERDADPS